MKEMKSILMKNGDKIVDKITNKSASFEWGFFVLTVFIVQNNSCAGNECLLC
jgi:hypothetical protein